MSLSSLSITQHYVMLKTAGTLHRPYLVESTIKPLLNPPSEIFQNAFLNLDINIHDPAPTDSKELLQWNVKDARVMTWILDSVDPLIVPNLRPYKTAKAMWDYLKKEYFSGFQTYGQNLVTLFMLSTFKQENTVTVAFTAQGKGKGRDMNNIQCYSCKEYGHIAANCGKKFCNYCKLLGHIIKECPTRPQNCRANASSVAMNSSNHFTAPVISTTPSTAAEPAVLTPEMV
ncbi:hypothetical protein GH714_011141 [Hevea brasiliensis]|uniref:CCHC-type domain-containing protein n=1 Tax=Hevea brasiliensis TaxID=3981 RepID=A0A6A6NGM6_HEVBR|nr:hypothetical protein GH714_011141 [Hevea brasiliensis]